jgi:membrane protein YdbS with pleckstrin-like domain
MEPLDPFLYQGTTDINAVLDQVRVSTAAKVEEIAALRETVARSDGARLTRDELGQQDVPRHTR